MKAKARNLRFNFIFHHIAMSNWDGPMMNTSRKLGILVFCGVPAIVGGGIVYAAFSSYALVFVYEILLLLVVGAFFSK